MMQMNKTPFYRTQWSPAGYNKVPSKVVTIPVHFVGSDHTRTESAIKIQKVTRGFMVRKSVKKLVAIKVELEQIENNVNAPETVELISKEQRERVRVSESIMNLLLRLDSVRVLHYSALRDCRKSLIKRAIALQELVDQMVAVVGPTHQDQTTQGQDSESDSVVDSSEMVVTDSEGMTEKALGNEKDEKERVGTGLAEEENCLVKEEEHEEGKKMESLRNEEKEDGEGKNVGEDLVEDNYLVKEEGYEVGCEVHEEGEKMEALRKMGIEVEVELEDKEEDGEGGCVGEESVGTSLVEEEIEEGEVGCEEENCKGGKRELLKRMMEDNQKMMEMMDQLFERNEMQTRLLSSLTKRVEQLERAFACDKFRRKNRRYADRYQTLQRN